MWLCTGRGCRERGGLDVKMQSSPQRREAVEEAGGLSLNHVLSGGGEDHGARGTQLQSWGEGENSRESPGSNWSTRRNLTGSQRSGQRTKRGE